MANLLFFLLATIGLTNIIVDSTIMQPLRDWVKNNVPEFYAQGVNCHQCVGAWCGALVGCLTLPIHHWLYPILFGCAGSFVSSFAANITELIGSQLYAYIGNETKDKP